MKCRAIVGGALLLLLLHRLSRADVVTLKNGRELEGVVVDVDNERLTLRRAAEGAFQVWQVTRSELSEVRLAPPETAGFRGVARKLESERSLQEAGEEWRRICVLRPESASDQVELVRIYRRAGNYEAAAAAGQTAAKALPKNPRIPLEQGEVALDQGRGADAVTFAREHLQLVESVSADGVWLLARGLEQSNQGEEALVEYRRLLRIQPRRGEALERFADLAMSLGKSDQAVEEAERTAKVAPELRAGWIALGKVRYRQTRYAEAVRAFQSATRLGGPDYDRARIFLQCALARRYDRDPRIALTAADLEIAPQLDPELRRTSP
jgi:tetratricopeptide (TPR) repeat protein